MTMILDAHCHLSFLEISEVETLVSPHVSDRSWVMGGYSPDEWKKQKSIKDLYPQIKSSYGLHPWYVVSTGFEKDRDLKVLETSLSQCDLVGELGLDFYKEEFKAKKNIQIEVFEKQLNLAENKPLVLHIVKAHEEALGILKNHGGRGYIHGWSGSYEMAKKYVDAGYLISFGQSLLNQKSKKVLHSFLNLPMDSILIESDSPSSPDAKENPIEVLDQVYKRASETKQMSIKEIQDQVSANFQNLFV